jgi:hypothetical protein
MENEPCQASAPTAQVTWTQNCEAPRHPQGQLQPAPINQTYPVTIQAAENGWAVAVGCKSFVFNEISDMMVEIKSYLLKQATELNAKYVKFPTKEKK